VAAALDDDGTDIKTVTSCGKGPPAAPGYDPVREAAGIVPTHTDCLTMTKFLSSVAGCRGSEAAPMNGLACAEPPPGGMQHWFGVSECGSWASSTPVRNRTAQSAPCRTPCTALPTH
jgi:hypothetical protein